MGISLQGIYNSLSGLATSQAGLNVVSNNVANLNTTGYTQESLNIEENSLSSEGNESVGNTSSLGGAAIESITRDRESYLDTTYRNENSSQAYYNELNTDGTSIENITNELSGTGINSALSSFYSAASSLSSDPTSESTRTAFVQAAQTVASEFNSTASSLTDLQTSLVGSTSNPSSIQSSKLATTVTSLNTDLSQLAQVNQSLTTASANGATDSSLLDQRDNLLDSISQYIPITSSLNPNGTATVALGNTTLVNSSQQAASLSVTASTDPTNPSTIELVDTSNPTNIINSNANSMMGNGQIGAILQVGGYNASSSSLSVGSTLNTLNTMAQAFAQSVNAQQTSSSINTTAGTVTQAMAMDPTGTTLVQPVTENVTDPVAGTVAGGIAQANENSSIFVYKDGQNMINGNATDETPTAETTDYQNLTASNITVNSAVLNNPYSIAAATVTYAIPTAPPATAATPPVLTGTGDGSNALAMSNLSNTGLSNLGNATPEDYLTTAVTNIGSQVASLTTSSTTATATAAQTQASRQSISGVSLDEELTNLTIYQRTYEASGQIMQDINTSLQTILGMSL